MLNLPEGHVRQIQILLSLHHFKQIPFRNLAKCSKFKLRFREIRKLQKENSIFFDLLSKIH